MGVVEDERGLGVGVAEETYPGRERGEVVDDVELVDVLVPVLVVGRRGQAGSRLVFLADPSHLLALGLKRHT